MMGNPANNPEKSLGIGQNKDNQNTNTNGAQASPESTVIDYIDPACYYLDNGINPIPCYSDKSPKLPVGHPYLYEFIENIPKYFNKADVQAIGIAAGKISGGIECIDFDCHQGQDIEPIFQGFINDSYVKQLEYEGKLSVFKTPSGGYHVVIKSDFYENKQILARWEDGELMIEVRGNGSYFITVPTPGYENISGVEIVKLDSMDKEDRQYLIDLARSFSKQQISEDNQDNKAVIFDSSNPVEWFNFHKWSYSAELLSEAGWVRKVDANGKPMLLHDGQYKREYWIRPGKDESKGHSATFSYRDGRFMVFSNAGEVEPFKPNGRYTPFDICMKLRFNDDFHKTLDWVLNKYFPDSNKPTQETEKPSANGNTLLCIKNANDWINEAKDRKQPEKLYDVFWFENEICILFADTNVGKSILAVQIADEISLHSKVIYADFELTGKQFEGRYSDNYQNHYKFSNNLLRIEINPDADIDDKKPFEDQLIDALESSVNETGAKIMIVDNITYIGTETEQSKNALPLMKKLKALKKKHDLSMLLLAHTPKRNLSKPITRNDLAGSKALINFVDSAFTIGESFNDKRLRYLKQIKCREAEIIYDTKNVKLYEIAKETNFLQFVHVGYASEIAHLKNIKDKDKEELENKVFELHHEGKSYREIANETGISHTQVNRIIDRLNQTSLDLKE
jgi:hypothetical protein